jgi:hypothetical protein
MNTYANNEIGMSGRDHWTILPSAIVSHIATSANVIGTSTMNDGVSNWIILPNVIVSPIATITNGQGTDTANNGVSNLIILGNQSASPYANLTNTMEIDATNMMEFVATNTMEIDATNDAGSNDVCPSTLKFPSQSKSPVQNSSSMVSKRGAIFRGRMCARSENIAYCFQRRSIF